MKYKYILYLFVIFTIFVLSSCTRRRHRELDRNSSRTKVEQKTTARTSYGKSVVKMEKQSGVYYVPCKINGTEMQFIFDTGASDITISAVEAIYLYKHGKLTDEDILGTQQYRIADGSISEGTVINLRSVTIGNRTLKNVQASIVHNLEAPLLLGQSALAKFGKISIDYKSLEITFE